MSASFNRARCLAAVACAALALAPTRAPAQYFGRNKVQYQTFQFRVLRTPHFRIYYYDEERQAATLVARMAERWYVRHSATLHHELQGSQPVILYASHPQFEQTNAIPGGIDEATGGVTEALKRRIVLPLAGPLAETDHVLGHELVHAFQYDITGQGRGSGAGVPTAAQMPLWFIEGMAEYLSLGPNDPNTAMWLRDAALRNKLPKYGQLRDPRYFPYRYGEAFLAYLASRYGDDVFGNLLRSAKRTGDIDRALLAVTRESGDSLVAHWHAAVNQWATAVQPAVRPASAYGRLLDARPDARLSVAPAISPDGSRVAFFSDRDLFSIELYVADVKTGQVQGALVRTAVDQHYESLEFISSAGAWDASGRRFVFGAIARGRPVLTILDTERNRVEREIPLPTIGEIFNPTWSPDGRAVAFSGLAGGLSDLFICDVQTGTVRPVTRDAYADLQPAWSPDGRTIAFVTDRFGTSLTDLRYGDYQLALYDVRSRSIRRLPAFDQAKHLNPQWSPDGASLYFISDPEGISNAYRLTLASGAIRQITSLPAGLSGITATSPAISVAQRSGTLVVTSFEEGAYRLYAIDRPDVLAGAAPVDLGSAQAARLPPPARPDSATLNRLADARTGLPSDSTFPVSTYRSRLSLDMIGPPSVAVGVDRFGTYVGGGTALYWSDLLGDQNLVTGLQVNGGLRDIAALLGYQNQRHRLNWGLVAQQVPYITGLPDDGFTQIGNEPAYVQQLLLQRQINRSFAGLLAYPFSRTQRVEASLGYQNISFDRELRTQAVSTQTGQLIFDSTVTLPSPNALNLGMADLALVSDNSIFGATSPILGSRYRLDVSPLIGSIKTTTVIADYRRYLMPVRPVTLAGRLMHVGRYGRDAEDPRLTALFLGYPDLVRGYTSGSFDPSECGSAPNGACPVFDQLLGSRLLVANAELRFPLLGVIGAGRGYYGALPVEAAVFADAGIAWNQGESPQLFGGSRKTVASAGAALRVNLLGFAIGQVAFVRPFQRPGKGWTWQFSLVPGF